MSQAMVTGRMSSSKKEQGTLALSRSGLNPSQAVNLLFDRAIEDGNADFLFGKCASESPDRWKEAARFVDSLSRKQETRFDDMTKAQVKADRLNSRGLI